MTGFDGETVDVGPVTVGQPLTRTEAASPVETAARATYLTQSGYRLLDDWGKNLRRMFPGEVAYLVGSALTTPAHRDVDVRLMLDDDDHFALASVVDLADLNLAVSLWGQQVTGLPIDFQVQHAETANQDYAGRRHPLGLLDLVAGACPGDPDPEAKVP